jgi:hypothetical protein
MTVANAMAKGTNQVDAPGRGSESGDTRGRLPERKGSPRPRGASGSSGNAPRPSDESRRKRTNERRYVAWGDGVERASCARAASLLPLTFPVASHPGVATIAVVVVARRVDAMLLCDYSHDDAHLWPDGEEVEVGGESSAVSPQSAVADGDSAN